MTLYQFLDALKWLLPLGLLVTLSGIFCMYVRDKYLRDVAPPDLHTDYERNPWLKLKDLALHSAMRNAK